MERIALAFVALSLVLLLVTPTVFAHRSGQLRDRMDEVLDPARTLVTESQFELAREMAALRGYLMTGDTVFLTRYRELVEFQARTIGEIMPLVRLLGDDATAAMLEYTLRVDRWHSRVQPGTPGRTVSPESGVRFPAEQRLFEAALDAATMVDQVLTDAARDLRRQIRREERIALGFGLGLALFAVTSTGLLLWFGGRLRSLAAVAQERRAEAEWALAETRRASEARERLIRGVTHDVKNPLGAADGYAELLQLGLRGEMTSVQAQTVGAIRRAIGSALEMIDELLELARAERGDLSVDRQDVDLRDLVTSVVESHRGVAEAADLSVDLSTPPYEVEAYTDARRVEQVMANLLGNAIKYTGPGGRVEVRLETVEENGTAHARISVIDDGPGIPDDERERVFMEFHRLDPGRGGGHGLGLAISRHIARRLHGEVTADGGPERGSTFVFRLPLDRVASAP